MMTIKEQTAAAWKRVDAIRDNLDSLKYAAPEMVFFWLNEIRENATLDDLDSALRIAPEGSPIDQPRSSYLPPNGTREEVVARVLAGLLCRTAIMFQDQPGASCMFSTDWQESQLEALRTAYPILGAFEDARVEETV